MSNTSRTITLIAALASNRCIGIDSGMAWHIPEDFRHFKTYTSGKPCVMGRKTYESILVELGKPLPGRDSLVVSRNGFSHEGAQVYPTLEEAIAAANGPEVCVIGGAQIYSLALPLADVLELTHIYKAYDGDAFFPDFSPDEWKEVRRIKRPGEPPEIPPFSFVRYERR